MLASEAGFQEPEEHESQSAKTQVYTATSEYLFLTEV
jgi:hypothetical protein